MRAQLVLSFSSIIRTACGRRISVQTYCPYLKSFQARTMANYSIYEAGAPNSLDYRMYFRDKDGPISPFHDIPLFADKEKSIFNMVVEIPRWSNAKMEIATTEALNPIKQDTKKGKLRFVNHCFPYHGYIWNYGALPQTWEDPNKKDASTDCNGDNDPIDVCDISSTVAQRGEVRQVKVLGILALIDEGETDWKVIAIDVKDPLAEKLHDIEDVEKYMPGLLKAGHDWLKIYKIPSGKPANQFGLNGEARNKSFALEIIQETHESWCKLMQKEIDNDKGLSLENITVEKSPFRISREEAQTIFKKAPSPEDAKAIDPSVNKWHFVDRSTYTLAN